MSLRYEWAWDVASIGALAIKVTDDGGTFEVTYTVASADTFCHTDISSVVSGYTAFADTLETDLNAGTSDADAVYSVTWSGTTGYTISATNTTVLSLAFSSFSGGSVDADGTRMKQILGMTADRTGATSYSSTVRPYFMLIPAIQGRSNMSDEYEPDGVMFESVADDGTAYHISKYTAEIWSDWVQQAETETAPSSFSSEGTYVFSRQATSAVGWTYQDAWEHMRLGDHPFLVLDGSESAVHEIRADGGSFKPQRFMGTDLPYWSIPFKTRLLGRL